MKKLSKSGRFIISTAILSALLLFYGCNRVIYSEANASKVQAQDTGGFPYHPAVFHLDLCVLAYQMYGQSLSWPYDPYYEQNAKPNRLRVSMMNNVRSWAEMKGYEQIKNGNTFGAFRGPGILSGFPSNILHDPIIFKYNHIYPWSPAITNPDGTWTEQFTPNEITGQIQKVYVCYRSTGQSPNATVLDSIIPRAQDRAANARDVLLSFEGGTGDKGEPNQPASQSLMGFVLLRYLPESDKYDVHVVFRGSRSGSASRAIMESLSTTEAKGNPDWITDIGYRLIDSTAGADQISTIGKVHRGMATSLKSIFPTLFTCLQEVDKLTGHQAPSRIYVSGHSLGGALAEHFVSSILIGNLYGPEGNGPSMPSELRNWPWKQIKLVTFGAPVVGDEQWATKLSVECLMSGFFSSNYKEPYDKSAIHTADLELIPRITNPSVPSAYRILVSTDPVTSGKLIEGEHIGKTLYVNKTYNADAAVLPNPGAHEPIRIRELMLASLNDKRIPLLSWRYYTMRELNPQRINRKKGTVEEYNKLHAIIDKYYLDRNIWFNHEEYMQDYKVFLQMVPPRKN